MSPQVEADFIRMLQADNARMRAAGTRLSEASLRVIREYDGTHRLALAVAEWATAIAGEGGRPRSYLPPIGRDADDAVDDPTGWSKISLAAREATGLDQETLADSYNVWIWSLPPTDRNPHQFKAFLAGIAFGASCDGSGEAGETAGLDPQDDSAVREAETPVRSPQPDHAPLETAQEGSGMEGRTC